MPAFEAFSRVCILLKLEMIGFLPIIFKLFFRVTGFAPLLRMFSNLGIRSNDIYRSSILIRKSLLTNALSKCGLYSSLFQLSLASTLFSIFLLCLCILRKPEACSILFYHLCQLLYRNCHSITKKRAISL